MAKRTSLWRRSSKITAALGLATLFAAVGCVVEETLKPAPGLMQYMAPLVLDVTGGRVSLATGNLQVERTDLSLDTSLGPFRVGAIYNSANDSWLWSFDLQHDGHHFTDPSGAWHDLSHVGIGETIPGTHWVVVDGHTMRTKAGLTYAFEDGGLASVHWWRNPDSRLDFRREVIAGQSRVTAIEYRCSGAYCADPLFTLDYDSAGRLERLVDHTGREAKFRYDALDRLVNARDALDIEKGWPGTSYGYTTLASGQSVLSSRTNSEGERIEFEFEGPRQQLSRVV
ncbi:MAG: RHS repeat domain-containing protein, partial [Myxococcota bacterium]